MKLRNIAAFAAVAITVATFFGVSGNLKAEAYTDVKEIYTKLMAAPSVIAEATDAEAFEKMQNAVVKPASALFAYEDGRAEYCGGGVAGELGDIKARLDESGILLVLRAGDSASPEELAEKINAAKITDFSVMSGDVEFLSYVSEHTVGVRTVYDAAKKTVDDPHEYFSAARKGGGNVVVLDEKQSDVATTSYLQARLISVWTTAENESEYGFAATVATGTYGIVCKDYEALIGLYGKYPLYSIPRTYYNVAHRGLSRRENENTIDAIAAAYECGATHVEIDVQMTKDGELAIMHDASVERTTDGTGKISELTKNELSAMSVIKNIDGKITGKKSKIPFLDDVLEYCKGKELIVVIEIKDTNPLTCALVASKIKKQKAEKQTIVISFYDGNDGALNKMHDIFPEIPLATLATVNADNFDGYIAKATEFNMAFDCSSQSSYANFANSNLKDRGYPVWQWTYDDASCAAIGVSGITNNVADEFKDHIKFIPEPTIELKGNAELQNAEFTIDAVTFGGETKKVKAIPLVTEATEGGFDAVLTVTDEASAKGLQRTVKAKLVVSANSSSGGASQKGCRSSLGSNYRILAAAFVAIIILKINVKKEKI